MSAAAQLVEEYSLDVDILVIDPLQADALPFLLRLKERQRGLNSIAALRPEIGEHYDLTAFTAVKRKPYGLDTEAVQEWVDLIHSLLERPHSASKHIF